MTIQSNFQNSAAKVQESASSTIAPMVSNQVQQTQNQNQSQNQMSNSVQSISDPALGRQINLYV